MPPASRSVPPGAPASIPPSAYAPGEVAPHRSLPPPGPLRSSAPPPRSEPPRISSAPPSVRPLSLAPEKPSQWVDIGKFVALLCLGMIGMRGVTAIRDWYDDVDRSGRTMADGRRCVVSMPEGWNARTKRIENAWLPWYRPGAELDFRLERLPGTYRRPILEAEFQQVVSIIRRQPGFARGTIESSTVMGKPVFAWESEMFQGVHQALQRTVVFDVDGERRYLMVMALGARTEESAAMLRRVTETVTCR